MKLYLVSRKDKIDYDNYDSFVVASKSVEAAKNTNPQNGEPIDWSKHEPFGCWAKSLHDLSVAYLGEARIGLPAGVVCASFNAG